ncbi:hypothetical protein ES703_111628 [subsurface metagenome]
MPLHLFDNYRLPLFELGDLSLRTNYEALLLWWVAVTTTPALLVNHIDYGHYILDRNWLVRVKSVYDISEFLHSCPLALRLWSRPSLGSYYLKCLPEGKRTQPFTNPQDLIALNNVIELLAFGTLPCERTPFLSPLYLGYG